MSRWQSRVGRPLKPVLRLMFGPLNAARLRVLDGIDDSAVKTMVRAIRKHQANTIDQGRGIIDRIESERRRLLSCDDPLSDGTLPEAFAAERSTTVSQACRASRPCRDARMLYLLIREYRPTSVLEIGTNVGISGAYIAAALSQNGAAGTLTTLEGSPYRQRIAKDLFSRIPLNNARFVGGMFQDTLEPTLREYGPFEFAFIDGHHEYEATLRYMDLIYSHSRHSAVFLFDDIRWSPGMTRAWRQITSDRRVTAALDLNTVGICIMSKEPKGKPVVAGPLYYQ